VHPNAPADRKPSIAQKVTAVVRPNKAPATKIVNLAELLRGDADDVQLVQSALNLKVTGKWDAATKSGYQKWQNSLGFKGKDADGMPGKTSLIKLGKKYGFKVI
jgi:hypothetical protein